MNKMFSESAEFSGLLNLANKFSVSQVLHKAFIDVHEKGVEAAAATCNILYL